MFNPLVSIIIPVFNGENYLSEAINSALNQTYDNVEIIVINDGSCDGGATKRVALQYAGRLKYFEKSNGGVASALNYGIEVMSGEYFSWLSHDDLYEPTKIEDQINFLSTINEDSAIVFSGFSVFSDANLLGRIYKPPAEALVSMKSALLKSSFLNGCTLLIPKKVFQVCGQFNNQLRHTQDYDMWFRLCDRFNFYYFDKPLVRSRSHQNQDSVIKNSEAVMEIDLLMLKQFKKISYKELSTVTNNVDLMGIPKLVMRFSMQGLSLTATMLINRFLFEKKITFSLRLIRPLVYILITKAIIFLNLYKLIFKMKALKI
jgi:glycosyltransferase involved in cell wall biosynthesis